MFELGFVLGRLGRSRATLLFSPDADIPSSLQGMLNIQLDQRGFGEVA